MKPSQRQSAVRSWQHQRRIEPHPPPTGRDPQTLMVSLTANGSQYILSPPRTNKLQILDFTEDVFFSLLVRNSHKNQELSNEVVYAGSMRRTSLRGGVRRGGHRCPANRPTPPHRIPALIEWPLEDPAERVDNSQSSWGTCKESRIQHFSFEEWWRDGGVKDIFKNLNSLENINWDLVTYIFFCHMSQALMDKIVWIVFRGNVTMVVIISIRRTNVEQKKSFKKVMESEL